MKDCPFCGDSAELKTSCGDRDGPGSVWVQCVRCGATVGNSEKYIWVEETNPQKHQDAINNWNKRV